MLPNPYRNVPLFSQIPNSPRNKVSGLFQSFCSYLNVAFISSLLSRRTQIEATFPRTPNEANNGIKKFPIKTETALEISIVKLTLNLKFLEKILH